MDYCIAFFSGGVTVAGIKYFANQPDPSKCNIPTSESMFADSNNRRIGSRAWGISSRADLFGAYHERCKVEALPH
jgi:hypothetical protein